MQDLNTYLSQIKNKKLLVVFPHPDDETATAAGLMQRARKLNYEVKVVSLTAGERGKIHVHGKGRRADEIRADEFERAMVALKIKDRQIWSYPDGKLRWAKSWKRELGDLIEAWKPGVVVSYDLGGLSGHPDHIALSLEIFLLLKSSRQEVKLLWPEFVGKAGKRVVNKTVVEFTVKPGLRLRMSWGELLSKWWAVKQYASQKLKGWDWVSRDEYFAEANFKKRYDYKYIKFGF